MNSPFTFEIEELEFADEKAAEQTCHCAKCQARSELEFPEHEEASENFTFEEEIFDEVPPLQKLGSYGAGLTREKTCWVQNVLNRAAGENLAVDGVFGPLTRAAAVRFQSSQGLPADGMVGKPTEIALIQTALNTIAQASLLPTNGVMDQRTVQQIRQFQSQHRLVVDGIVGPITRGAMITALGGRRCYIPAPPKPKPTPKPPIPPTQPTPGQPSPACDRTKFDNLVLECDREYRKCLISRCGLSYVISQVKLIPELAPCAELKTGPLILLCALAKGGKDVIDNIINAKACKDTCASNKNLCGINAGSASHCL